MEPAAHSITVMVEREVPGPVVVRVVRVVRVVPLRREGDAGTVARPMEFRGRPVTTLHEVKVNGLEPGVRYRYEVSGPALANSGGTFTTPPSSFAPLRFLIYGDTRSGMAVHQAVVRAMEHEGADFVLHTGDLIGDGRNETLWQHFFDIERDLLRNVPLVPVIGNHEIVYTRSGTTEGIERFRRYVHLERNSPAPELDFSFAYGSVRIIAANAYSDWNSPQVRAWLAERLDRAHREVPDGFVIVAMHWGLCSSGPHGENRAARASGLPDLFRQHGADLLVSGHDHLYERGDDAGLRYIVSGGGGAELYHQTRVPSYSLASVSEHHYVRVDVERDRLQLAAVRIDGSVIERCALRHSGWDCPPLARSAPLVPQRERRVVLHGAPVSPKSAPPRSCSCSVPERAQGVTGWLVLVALAALRFLR